MRLRNLWSVVLLGVGVGRANAQVAGAWHADLRHLVHLIDSVHPWP